MDKFSQLKIKSNRTVNTVTNSAASSRIGYIQSNNKINLQKNNYSFTGGNQQITGQNNYFDFDQ